MLVLHKWYSMFQKKLNWAFFIMYINIVFSIKLQKLANNLEFAIISFQFL